VFLQEEITLASFTVEQFKPINGYLLVRADPEKWQSESGLIVRPEGSREHLWRRGTILRGSDGWAKMRQKNGDLKWRKIPCPFDPGTRIIFAFYYAEYSNQLRVLVDDPNVLLLKPEDIVLYDDPELKGKGIDDVSLSEGHWDVKADKNTEKA
jgi:hypothetical protein